VLKILQHHRRYGRSSGPIRLHGTHDDAATVTDADGRTMRLPWHDAIRTAARGGRFSFNDR
jgi:hypothetical protein